MRCKQPLLLLLFVCLLLLAGGAPLSAQPPVPTPAPESGPTLDPAGNVVGAAPDSTALTAPAAASAPASPTILCFTTRTSADPCTRVSGLFSSVTVARSQSQIPSDLSSYDVVYIGYDEGDLLAPHADRFESYISAGGGLIVSQPNLTGTVEVYPPGFEMTVTDQAWPGFPNRPGPVEFTAAGAAHPILNGLTSEDVSGNFDTVPLSTLGPSWTMLVKAVSFPHVALAVGRHGAGRLAFHSGNIGSLSVDPGSDAYVRQLIEWAGAADAPPGPNMGIDAIEVTQAVQDLNNSVDLIAGKRTYVRVHVNAPSSVNAVTANLSGQRDGRTLYPTLLPGNPGADITVRTSPNRGLLDDSFWFELPAAWTGSGSLTLTARLDPANAKNDPNLANNTHSVTVNFLQSPPLNLRLVNVQYEMDGTTYLADTLHIGAVESWLRRAYPISSLAVARQTWVYPEDGLPNVDRLHGYLALMKILRILFTSESGDTIYYGLVDDGGDFMRGKTADIPSTISAGPTGRPSRWPAFSWDTDDSYGDWYAGHEIGHATGRYHAEYCGAVQGTDYPYAGGRISPDLSGSTALYGFDITDRTIYGPSWKDVMTYCNNQWVSDFTYEGIRDYLATVTAMAAAAHEVRAGRFLAVTGLADLSDNTAELQSVYLIDHDTTAPLPTPGDWTLALVAADGSDLATYPFKPNELTDSAEGSGRPAVIAVVVPWSEGAVGVEIRVAERTVATRAASGAPPTLSIDLPQPQQQLPEGPVTFRWTATDPDGDSLTYSVLYSWNGGDSWEVLATDLDRPELTLDTSLLPGGASSLLRVVASDGFLTAEATTGPFSVPPKAPAVTIEQPLADSIFATAQLVSFFGTAYDPEDGQLVNDALHWSSSIDGDLGTGASLATVDLSTGTHVITLRATDSDGQVGEAQRTIVVHTGSEAEPVSLNVAPGALGASVFPGADPFTETVSIGSSGDTELEWSAAITVPWAELHATSGSTPNELVVTINPSNLAVGSYAGSLRLTAVGASNSPLSLPIVLDILAPPPPRTMFLPLILLR